MRRAASRLAAATNAVLPAGRRSSPRSWPGCGAVAPLDVRCRPWVVELPAMRACEILGLPIMRRQTGDVDDDFYADDVVDDQTT